MKTKVALFVNGWNGENVDNFIDGFNCYFSNNDVDLFVFTSFSLSVNTPARHIAEDSVYSLPDYSFFDAAVIFGSGINSDDVVSELINRCDEAGIPVVLQGIERDGISTVNVEGNVGMRALCEHLTGEHGVRDVIFIAGPRDNADSNARMAVLKEVLEEHGSSLEEDKVFHADWSSAYIREYLHEHFVVKKEKLPDAFVCANDQMAMFVVFSLEKFGYRLPDDVLVTGFDDLSDGMLCFPSLATVDQGYTKQGTECAKFISEALSGNKLIRKSVIPCAALPGESCGCFECNGESELRKRIGRMWWSERYSSENLQIREAQLDMCVMSNSLFEQIHKSVNKDFLASVGEETEDFHIYVNPQYKELEYMNLPADAVHNAGFAPVMDVICARTGGVVCSEDNMAVKELLLGYDGVGKGKTFIFRSLMIDDSVVGYMVTNYKKDIYKKKDTVELSSSISKTLKKFQRNIDDYNKAIRIQEQANEFLRQTVEALATAVDAKDSYTNGHSNRVAKYSRYIAQEAGMSEKECDDVYLAGLLHDVGKIGIDDSIINKKGKLTDEEFAVIKLHPGLGGQILSKIVMSPSLSVGARYHHERYDGKGYPDRLKGDEIPRIARIIAVADAYDAMTSTRSYRNVIPQMYVREELIKGMGTQFDPEYARIMIKLLDRDEGYTMKESRAEEALGVNRTYKFDDYKSNVSTGIRITDCPISIKVQYKPLRNGGQPTLLFYDSADARYYIEDSLIAGEMDFVEFAGVDINGTVYADYVRKTIQTKTGDSELGLESDKVYTADVYIVKQDDHLLVRITTDKRTDEITFALYDAARYVYLALTGEFCSLTVLAVAVDQEPIEEGSIPRIVEKITYTDRPTGDIPNFQIDGWIANHSEIMKLNDDVNVSFHTMSLPSSRRVWHCPIVVMFTSDDGKIDGANYKELAYIRLDGEVWCDNPEITNKPVIMKSEEFDNWSIWKQKNKAGVYCKLAIVREGNSIELQVENCGLQIKNTTTIPEAITDVYFYLTGDQCALTDIRIDND